ncbi:mitotic-spindle organizing protein 2 isoform X4 [Pseudochaenichthys georgianus]|uniref:mitotic-spindle organizing protein 2 isoform X4 n=1 Tax=Pseudochaenichthys georgianus TaxID=52239 RepID=UPI00146C33E5|nr:mitotic-spindle organizing protein 2 isoform X4 [Pseudochaenichthys georgianus]
MSQQTAPPAPDSPALLVTSNVQKYAIKKKKVLSTEEAELFELTQAAGVTMDQEVFKIIVDLLKMNVAPQAVFQTLKAMLAGQRVAESCGIGESSTVPHTTSITTAPTEARVRSKAAAGHSERSREASSQRVQRQPSATRGPKTKSSGSSSSSSQINST